MISRCRLLVLFAIATAFVAPAIAESADDGQGLQACDADIHRLCQAAYPDEKRVATCLVERRSQLSRACAEVLAHPDLFEEDD